MIVTTAPGTIQRILRGQPRFLQQHFDVSVVTSNGQACKDIALEEGVQVHNVDMKRRISLWQDTISLFRLFALFRKVRPDIVHSYTPKAGLLAMVAAWAARVDVRIHTFTGLIFPTAKGLKKKILIFCDRLACWCATTIVPEGNGVKKDLLAFRITSKPLNVIGAGNIAGVDTTIFAPNLPNVLADAAKIKEDLKLTQKHFVFCFVGRLNRDKGIRELCQAFSAMKDKTIRLVLIGRFDPSNPVDSTTLDILNSDSRVHMLGFQEDVRPVMAISHVLVLPSYREGFPNVPLQAAGMQLPTIATDVNGCNEAVVEGKTGWLVPAHDAAALERKMTEVMEIPADQLQTFGQAGRERIAEQFEQSVYRDELLKFYRNEAADGNSLTVS